MFVRTGLGLRKFLRTPRAVREALCLQKIDHRHRFYAAMKSTLSNAESLPSSASRFENDDEWEEVAGERIPALVHPPVPVKNPPLPPYAMIPNSQTGDWLRHPDLIGKKVDVCVFQCDMYKGMYNGRVGYVEAVPERFNASGSIRVRVGNTNATVSLRVFHLLPCVTTELEPFISRADAVYVLDVPGVRVVIIGPASDRSWEFMGKVGVTTVDRLVRIDRMDIAFPITSLCRSHPVPAYARERAAEWALV